jgi:flagellar motor switch protein FliG
LAAVAVDEVALQKANAPPQPRRPFQFLETIEAAHLAERLRVEHPQTIALVAVHAPRALAADLLWRLPEALRADVLARVIDWQGTDAHFLEEVEQTLEMSLAAAPGRATGGVGLAAAREILQSVAEVERAEFLHRFSHSNSDKADLLRYSLGEFSSEPCAEPENCKMPEEPNASSELQEEIKHDAPATQPPQDVTPAPLRVLVPPVDESPPVEPTPLIAFHEFSRFDDRTLSRVFAEAEPPVALLALTGAPAPLVDRLLHRLPRREAARLRQHMEKLGAFSLRDLEAAQTELAHVASRLVVEGKIRLPPRRRSA